MRTVADVPRNEAGLVDKYIGTAYDVVLRVYKSIDTIDTLSTNINNINSVAAASNAINELVEELTVLKELYNSLEDLKVLADAISELQDIANNLEQVISVAESLKDKRLITIVDSVSDLTSVNTDYYSFARIYVEYTDGTYGFDEYAYSSTTNNWIKINSTSNGNLLGDSAYTYEIASSTTTLKLTTTLADVAVVYINGVRQDAGYGYSYNSSTSEITFADNVEVGDLVTVVGLESEYTSNVFKSVIPTIIAAMHDLNVDSVATLVKGLDLSEYSIVYDATSGTSWYTNSLTGTVSSWELSSNGLTVTTDIAVTELESASIIDNINSLLTEVANNAKNIEANKVAINNLSDGSDVTLGDALIAVKQPYTGAVTRTQHDKNIEFLSVLDFGAKGNGSTDDSDSIQKAIDAAASLGGGNVYIPAVKNAYLISKPLLISNDAVSLIGVGSTSNHDNSITMEGSIIKASTSMDYMIKIEPTSTTRLNHNNLIGLFLDGDNLSSVGVSWLSSCQSTVDIDGRNFTGTFFDMGCSVNPTESRDPQNNNISLNYRGDSGIILNCSGITKSSSTTGVGSNCSMNTFNMIKGVLGTSSAAINLIDADNNVFKQVILYYYGSADNGVYLENDKDEGGAYNNTFEFYSANKKIYGTGGGTNRILYIDSANGTPLPVWGDRNFKEFVQGGDSPIGYETYEISQDAISSKKSNGLIEFKGKITIAANSTTAVTFPSSLSTTVINYGVSAVGVSSSFIISTPTLTGISLANQNSGEVTVYWWAEGY